MLFFILLLCFLLSFSTLPDPVDPVVDSLPPYQTKTAYTEGDFQDYTFDVFLIDENDYLYISVQDSDHPLYHYDLYFFDTDTNMLYFFHNNI